MRKRYFIDIAGNDRLIVYCPENILKENNLNRIAFGSKSIEVEFFPHHLNENRIVISKGIQKAIQFPNFSIPLHLFIENQMLFLGPLIGIFTAGFVPSPVRPIGERSSFFSKLLSVSKKVGALPFIFGEKHIDWEKGSINGYFFHKENWIKMMVPFPNVIYDRLPNRKSERNPKLKNVKERLEKNYLIPWYNPGFFNKLDVYERLQQDSTITDYLPETHPFTSFSLIETMLAKYGHVYIKPINGSLGLGVKQIIYDKHKGAYFCRYQDLEGVNRLRMFSSIEGLFNTAFANQNLSKLLVQQGIHLFRYEQRPVDFRIHTNKDELGYWHVTAIAAKIAGLGSVTTHKRSGGDIKTIAEIFPKDECEGITEKLTNAAILLSKAIERNLEGIIGEIGFDLALDKNGRVWLFEANSKPGRSIFTHPELKAFDYLTRKLSLSFGIYLTEQSLLNPEDVYK